MCEKSVQLGDNIDLYVIIILDVIRGFAWLDTRWGGGAIMGWLCSEYRLIVAIAKTYSYIYSYRFYDTSVIRNG